MLRLNEAIAQSVTLNKLKLLRLGDKLEVLNSIEINPSPKHHHPFQLLP